MDDKNRLLGLEVIRFVAACIVLFVHYHFLCDVGIRRSLPTVTFYPFYHTVPYIYSLSEWAVRIFWGISGFIFFWKYQPLIAQGKVGFREFAVSRFARLYPLHLLTLMLVAAGQAVYFQLTGLHFLNDVHYSGPHFASQLFMAGNRIFKGDSFNWPVWSVSLEIAVYVLFFAVTHYVTKSVWFNVLVIALFVLIRVTLPQTEFMGLAECLLFFYIGGMAAIVKRSSPTSDAARLLVRTAAGIIPFWFWLSGGLYLPGPGFIFWCLWLPVVLYCAADDLKVSAPVRKTVEAFGSMTYASYLMHIPVLLLMAIISVRWKILWPVFNPLFLAGYMGSIFGLSYLLYRYFERPVQEAIKAAAARGHDGLLSRVLISLGVFIYACLAFTPVVSKFDRNAPKPPARGARYVIGTIARGHMLFKEGKDSEALAVYEKAIAVYPFHPIIYANMGVIYIRNGDYATALKNLDRAIAINPNFFQAYNNRSAVYNAQGRLDLALRDLRKAQTVDPCPDAFLALKKRHPQIVNYAMMSDEIQNEICLESAHLYSNLGLIHSSRGEHAQAIGYYDRAIMRDPKMIKAYGGRAVSYFKLGEFDRARSDAEQAVKLGARVDPQLLKGSAGH